MPAEPAPAEEPVVSPLPAAVAATPAPEDGLGPPRIRTFAWLLAIGSALALAAGIPLLQLLLADQPLKEPASLLSMSMLPVLPLVLFGVWCLLINPWLGRLRLSGRELLIVLAFQFVVGGIAESGLRNNWLSSLFIEDDLSRQAKLRDTQEAMPGELSLNAGGVVADALNLFERIERQPDARQWQQIASDWRRLDLSRDLQLSPAGLAALNARAAGEAAELTPLSADILRLRPLMVSELATLQGLRDGNREVATFFTPIGDGPSPAARVWRPLAASALLQISGLILVMGLVAFTAYQWTHNERLQHPLVQMPIALANGTARRNRLFWTALITVLCIWLYQLGAQHQWHVLPALQLGQQPFVQMSDLMSLFGIEVPGSLTWLYEGKLGALRIFIFVIGIAFLLASDVGFSIWGGFFFGMLIFGWLTTAGLPVDFNTTLRGNGAGGGAMIALALVVFYLGRHHYAALLRRACGLRTGETAAADAMGVLGARMMILGIFAVILSTWYYAGGGFSGALSGIFAALFLIVFSLVTARIIAESGLACFQSSSLATQLTSGLNVPLLLPLRAVLLVNYLGATLYMDTRQHLSGYAVQSAIMAETAGRATARFFILLTATVVVGALLAVVVSLLSYWAGAHGLTLGDAVGKFGFKTMQDQLQRGHEAVWLGMSEKQLSVLGGFLAVFAIVGLRRVWAGCILHPIGIVVAASFPVMNVWGSLALGWLAKILVLRYGGSALYTKLKPVAFGIILGDILGYALELSIRGIIYANQGYMPDSYNAWP